MSNQSPDNSRNLRTLLIVDDEPDLRETLADMCIELTSQIITAADGKEAFELIQNNQIDAVLSDINMPRMNGLQLLAEIRASGNDIPFVILTGHGDKANVTEALRLGATDFIEKPFSLDELLSVLDYALELGMSLKEISKELDLMNEQSDMPADKLIKLKKARRAITMMKKNLDLFKRKKRVG